jgi:DNA (cytosine-5)-methyltransferase 1
MDPEEARKLRIKRPLEEATLARIAKGLYRYTIATADPFIVPVTHQGDLRAHDVQEPLRTVTGAKRGEFALVAPYLPSLGERPARSRRPAEEPLSDDHVQGSPGGDLASVYLTKFSENSTGHKPDEPLHTVMAGAPRHGLVAAFMEQANTGMVGHDARDAGLHDRRRGTTQRLVTAQLSQLRGSNRGKGDPASRSRRSRPAAVTRRSWRRRWNRTWTDGAAVRSDRAGASRLPGQILRGRRRARTSTTRWGPSRQRSRFGLVVVAGQAFRIVDIGMRMLDPETELAAAMGVPKGYVLGFRADGSKVTKTDVTKMVGNMVERHVAAALIRANCADLTAPEALAA